MLWRALLAIALWLCLMDWPGAPGVGLDPSWQQMLADAWNQRRRFGRDLIFTYGPWGTFFVKDTLPSLAATKIVFEIVGKLFAAILLVELCSRLPVARRTIFGASMLLLGWLYPDPFFVLLIVVLTFAWLTPPDASPLRVATGIVVLSVIGLAKFTLLVLAAVCVVSAALITAAAGRSQRAALMVVGWIAALAAAWLAAGQRLIDIPEYVRLSREMSIGYAGAMYVDETWPMFGLGVALVVTHAAWLSWFVLRAGFRVDTLVTAACLAASLAMTWKLGFTRADSHVIAFFVCSLWLVAAAPALIRRTIPVAFLVVAMCLSIAGLTLALESQTANLPGTTWQRLVRSATQLAALGEYQARVDREAARVAADHQLPSVRAEVGSKSIDYFGDNQALVFLNGLSYHPRPAPQSYAAYTAALLQKNVDFIQSPQRPDYILATLLPIDGRYGAQNDAMMLAELPRRYERVLVENGQLLLKQRARQPEAGGLPMTPLVERAVNLGEEVTLPSERTHALWLEVDAGSSLRGSLRSLLYKPAGLTLTTVDEGNRRETFRLVAGIARAGFIVQPALVDGADVEALIGGEVSRWLKAVTVDVAPRAQAYWEGPLRVRISRLDGVPLRPKSPFAVLVENGVTNLQPETVTSDLEWRLMLDPEPVLFLHATGAATFQPPQEQRRLTGRFGISEGAYTLGNKTDGVDFTVGIVRPGAAEETVFMRTLQPLTRDADRGPQAFAIDLPADPDLRVIIRTGPGAAGDDRWDWSYVSALRFTPRP